MKGCNTIRDITHTNLVHTVLNIFDRIILCEELKHDFVLFCMILFKIDVNLHCMISQY